MSAPSVGGPTRAFRTGSTGNQDRAILNKFQRGDKSAHFPDAKGRDSALGPGVAEAGSRRG